MLAQCYVPLVGAWLCWMNVFAILDLIPSDYSIKFQLEHRYCKIQIHIKLFFWKYDI